MTQLYNDPAGGTVSTVDQNSGSDQIRTDYYNRKALYETRKDRYFAPLADSSITSMPRHYGKKIKKYHVMPLLDDRNINDQGLDADGADTNNPNGNLYGSSKDVGLINERLPILGETGGRVNRVGWSRIELEGTMQNYGMFQEFTEDLLNFDSMADLYEHMSRELVNGAVQLTEALLQIDLIECAGVTRYGGEATDTSEMTGEGDDISVVTYSDLQALSITLDDNRSPKKVKMLKGSSKFDTVTVDNCRLLYCGSELIPTITKMTDHFGNEAFVSVEKYGYSGSYKEGTNMIHGEIGKVGQFRIIVVPEMLHYASSGAAEETNEGYSATDGFYDVYPMLTIGDESFTTIGFQTGGGSNFKFKIKTKMPGEVLTTDDPYGKTGFSSIQFWYGFMPLRTERIGVQWTVAES